MRDRRPAAALMIFMGALTAVRLVLITKCYHDSLGEQQPNYLGLLTIIGVSTYLSVRLLPLMQHYMGIFAEDNAAVVGNHRNRDAIARAQIQENQIR